MHLFDMKMRDKGFQGKKRKKEGNEAVNERVKMQD